MTAPAHDDPVLAYLYAMAAYRVYERREAARQAFEGPFRIRAMQALSSTLLFMVFYTLAIEVLPWALRGRAVPLWVIFFPAGFAAAGLILRGLLADRARRCGGIYDGRFRVLE